MQNKLKVAAVQAAPVFLDAAATTKKTIELIERAAAGGGSLVAFPETWLPGYPWWVWLGAPSWGMQFFPEYYRESITVDGPEMKAIREAAAKNSIHVVLGFSERDGGSLYMAQSLIGPDGEIIYSRRKLKPTFVERTVFGEGDGSDIQVIDTTIGRVGALCCWEHYQPLTKYAMYAMNEQIHVASWPAFSLLRGVAYALGPEANTTASQMYALEGQCFVVASCALLSQDVFDRLCDSPDKTNILNPIGGAPGGGFSMIFGPDGRPLADPIPHTEEGILFAEVSLDDIAIAKIAADPAGHYSRPDVFRLIFNRAKNRPLLSPSGADAAVNAAAETVDG